MIEQRPPICQDGTTRRRLRMRGSVSTGVNFTVVVDDKKNDWKRSRTVVRLVQKYDDKTC